MFRVVMNNLAGNKEYLDETFDTYDEAYDYARESENDMAVGAEVLELANEDFESPEMFEFEVEEFEE